MIPSHIIKLQYDTRIEKYTSGPEQSPRTDKYIHPIYDKETLQFSE